MKKFLEKIKPRLLIMCLIAGFWLIVIILRLVFAEYQSAYINEIYKPPFYPPVFVFYLVWGLTLIGLTVSTVLAVFKSKNKNLIVIIIFNGVLNILLPLFFYTLRSKISGVIILLFLIISAISLFKMLLKIKHWYAYITIPYLMWLAFLIALNYAILMIN